MIDKSQMISLPASNIGGFQISQTPKISKSDIKIASNVSLSQTRAILTVLIPLMKSLSQSDNIDEATVIQIAKKAISSTVGRLICHIEDLNDAD